MSDFEKIIKRATSDQGFHRKLSVDPAAALREAGVDATPEKVQAVQRSKDALRHARAKFGESPKTQ